MQKFEPAQIDYMLGHCADFCEGNKLTVWERDFIESICEQFERTRFLSEKQLEVLERIYCKLP